MTLRLPWVFFVHDGPRASSFVMDRRFLRGCLLPSVCQTTAQRRAAFGTTIAYFSQTEKTRDFCRLFNTIVVVLLGEKTQWLLPALPFHHRCSAALFSSHHMSFLINHQTRDSKLNWLVPAVPYNHQSGFTASAVYLSLISFASLVSDSSVFIIPVPFCTAGRNHANRSGCLSSACSRGAL
jgi:hypothetical protein